MQFSKADIAAALQVAAGAFSSHPLSFYMENTSVHRKVCRRMVCGAAILRSGGAAGTCALVLGSWGETMRDAARDKERWKGRHVRLLPKILVLLIDAIGVF